MQVLRLDRFLQGTPAGRVRILDAASHASWRTRVRDVVRRLARLEAIEPLRVVSVTRNSRRGLQVEDHQFAAVDGRSLRGTLLLPPHGTRRPAILVCPGRNASIEAVTGASPPDHPDRNVAERLALAGFATLTLDYGILGGLDAGRLAGRDETNLLALALALTGHSLLGLLVQDASAALAWLESRPDVDPERLGICGVSLGGHVALHTALVADRPLSVALASCFGRYATMFRRDLTGGGAHALPGMLRHADLPELASAIAPWPLHIQHGSEDRILPVEDAQVAMDQVSRALRAAGLADSLDLHVLPIGHGTAVAPIAEFFRRHAESPRPQHRVVPAAKVSFDGAARAEILERVDESLSTGVLTLGPFGKQFEAAVGSRVGGREVVAVSSGTSALEIALRVIGVAGRPVLVTANTFFATASAAIHAGGRVVFVDNEPDGLGLAPSALRQALAEHPDTAAVVTVHIGGVVSPALRGVVAECEARGVPLVEDAAHALGSQLDGRAAGTFGRMAAFSMYPTKVVTSGEGGFIAVRDAADAALARRYRDQGKASFENNLHGLLGNNWRMSEVHAGIGISHVERLEALVAERRELAAYYDEQLVTVPRIRPFRIPSGVFTNVYKYIAFLDPGVDRAVLKQRLRARGVSLSGEVYEIPCCAQPYFGGTFGPDRFATAYQFCRAHVCLPIFPTMTRAQQQLVVEALKSELL